MTTEELSDLKKKLPRGWVTRLSLMSGLSKDTVWSVFNGRSRNTLVIDAAIRLFEEEQLRNTKIKQILES